MKFSENLLSPINTSHISKSLFPRKAVLRGYEANRPTAFCRVGQNILSGRIVSRYSDYLIWHSTFLGIVDCELDASSRAIPESEKEIAILNNLDIPHQRCLIYESAAAVPQLHKKLRPS